MKRSPDALPTSWTAPERALIALLTAVAPARGKKF
jgi:hypothetical protein